MEFVYLKLPELPEYRHIIVGDRHIINTAARPGNVYHLYAQLQPLERKQIKQKIESRREAPR